MKFTINTNDFKNAMEKAYKAVDKKSVLPILQNVKLHIEKDSNYILGANLENFVLTKVDVCNCDTTLDIVFRDTETILKAMKFFSGNEINFEVNQGKVVISCGNKQTAQMLFDEEEPCVNIPEFDTVSSNQYQYDVAALKDRFNLIKYAASQKDNKPILMGIHFNDSDMVALDGYRLALSKVNELSIKKPFTVLANSISLMIDVLKKGIKIETNDKYIKVSDNETTVISRLLDGQYVDYQGVIPRDGKEISIDIAEYENVLKYFKVFKQTGKNTSKQNVMWLNGNLKLIGTGTKGTIENINGSFDAPIGFDNKFMLDAMAQFKTDKVTIMVGSPVTPMVIKSDDSYLSLVLPVRLKPEDIEAFQVA